MNKYQNSQTQLNLLFIHVSLSELKILIWTFYYIVCQFAILFQSPFIQIDFIVHFYLAMIFIVSFKMYQFVNKKDEHVYYFIFDMFILFLLMGSHPSISSFNFIMILTNLFIAGSVLNKKDTFYLTLFCSVMLSIINLKLTRWIGLQNLLSLVLFNFSFVIVAIISQQFKLQISSLNETIKETIIQLRSKEEFAQILVEEIPSGLSALNSQNEFLYLNKNIFNQLNLTEVDLILIKDKLNSKKAGEISYYNNQLLQKRIYEVNQENFYDQYLKDLITILMVKDVTEIKNIEDRMRQQEKLAAIGQLAAGIAHEIRNPLAGISGSIQLLNQDSKNSEDQILMKIILKEIDRLNHLITEFLDYSKPEGRPDQMIDLSVVINEVMMNIQKTASYPPNLSLDLQLKPMLILGFADKLKQVFLNIVMNALQAMATIESPKLSIQVYEDQNQLAVISIKDNGIGMSPETQKRVFEPFYTTKSKGTGLGLAISHKVLEAHQAEVSIQSELGVGTEFILKFKKG